ncbi:MAG: NUDIX domain-containing protein [Acidimicrobiia bacterium]
MAEGGDGGPERGSVSAAELLGWADALREAAVAALRFTGSLYEGERFEEVGRIAADIRAAVRAPVLPEGVAGAPGSVAGTPPPAGPKTAAGALVANDAGDILLVQRSDSGAWLFPAGLADVGYSPSEVAIKETAEETGIAVEPVSLAAVFDATRFGFHGLPLYVIVFSCRIVGGQLRRHPLETMDVGFFPRRRLPGPLAGGAWWIDLAFAATREGPRPCVFDRPRPERMT